MWIHQKKIMTNGKTISVENKNEYEKALKDFVNSIDTLTINRNIVVVERDEKYLNRSFKINNEDDLINFLFAQYTWYHHTKSRKAVFEYKGTKLFLEFT